MTFKEWKAYWKRSPWTTKWFALFIFLRPIVDNFYKLKEVSAFISPIYILGVLTPLFAVYYGSKLKVKSPSSPADSVMRFWLFLITANCILMLIRDFSLDNLGDCIKYVTPPLIFLFLRKAVNTKEDLHFLLTTFLYSCIFPFAMIFFELLVHPIAPEYASEGRGGGERIRGQYADSMNYALFLVGFFMVFSYLFLYEIYNKVKLKIRQTSVSKLMAGFVFCLIGIISLRHVSTWGVFLSLIVLLMYFNAQNAKGMIFVVFIALIIVPFFADKIYEKEVRPLIEKEFSVISGDKDVSYALDGRVARWQKYFEIWDEQPYISHIIGIGFSNVKEATVMTGGGMHNDYVRILFLTGFLGVALYVLFFLFLLGRSKYLRPPEKFLLIGSVAIFMLYSISAVPTLYGGIFSLTFPVFCFAVLPRKQAYNIPNVKKPVFFQRPMPLSDSGSI